MFTYIICSKKKGELLYIGTDEKELKWFEPLKQRHNIRFLNDYFDLMGDLDKSLYGMVEQVVMSRGRTFTGTVCVCVRVVYILHM